VSSVYFQVAVPYDMNILVFIARHRSTARYWCSNSVCPSDTDLCYAKRLSRSTSK